jgi:hypothetical protein
MNRNIQSQFPFLIMAGNMLRSDYIFHLVMAKFEDGTREIYKHVVCIDGQPYFDKEPILMDSNEEYQIDNATYKHNFLLKHAYQLGLDNCSDRFVWSNAISAYAFQLRYEAGKDECFQIMKFNRKNPGNLLPQIRRYSLAANPSSKEYYRWHVICPFGPTIWDHGFWMDTFNNTWHCEKCKVSGDNAEPWRHRWNALKRKGNGTNTNS